MSVNPSALSSLKVKKLSPSHTLMVNDSTTFKLLHLVFVYSIILIGYLLLPTNSTAQTTPTSTTSFTKTNTSITSPLSTSYETSSSSGGRRDGRLWLSAIDKNNNNNNGKTGNGARTSSILGRLLSILSGRGSGSGSLLNINPLLSDDREQNDDQGESRKGASGAARSGMDENLEVNKLAESRGFSIESHHVTTKDGYILTIHRLVNPLNDIMSTPSSDPQTTHHPNHNNTTTKMNRGQRRVPIIVQHGIMCASPFFLINSSPLSDRPRPPFYYHVSKTATNYTGENTDTSSYTYTCTYNNNSNSNNSNNHDDDDEIHTVPRISNSLAFELAQRGHDVWLPNFRGTQYSRAHLRQDLNENGHNSSAYWNFNVDTLIEQDLKAYVEYVLDYTGTKRYMFIGHSLGATVGLGSLLVHQNSRITEQLSCAMLMAPVASTQYMQGQLIGLFRTASLLYQEPGPFPGATKTFSSFVGQICPQLKPICLWLASMFIGAKRNSDSIMLNSSDRRDLLSRWTLMDKAKSLFNWRPKQPRRPVAAGNKKTRTDIRNEDLPSSSSSSSSEVKLEVEVDEKEEFQNQLDTFTMMMRQSVSVQMLKHIVQVHSSGRLSRFNYGSRANELRYGNSLAPIYDLSKINQTKLSLAIVSGQSDAISTPGEVGWISEQVRDKVGHFEQITVPVSPFNHMDLIMSSEAGEFVNKRMLEFIQRNKCLAAAAQ